MSKFHLASIIITSWWWLIPTAISVVCIYEECANCGEAAEGRLLAKAINLLLIVFSWLVYFTILYFMSA